MSNLLPILQSQAAPMSICSFCAKPGSCCTNFILTDLDGEYFTAWESTWVKDANARLAREGLPYHPKMDAELAKFTSPEGEIYVIPVFECAHLQDNGRCGIYESRPNVCRKFLPASGPLCIMTDIVGGNKSIERK